MRMLFQLVVLSLGVLLCGAAAAQAESQADEEGRGFFIAGRAAFIAGHYEEALERFEHSYAKSGRPVLLYNIGNAAERAGRAERALEAFEEFLARVPEAEQREEVASRVALLRPRVAALRDALAAAPSASQAALEGPADAAPRPRVVWPASALGASVAALAGGGTLLAFGILARRRVEDAPDGARYADYASDYRHAPILSNAGIGLLAVGAVCAGASSWWLWRAKAGRLEAALGPRTLTLRARF